MKLPMVGDHHRRRNDGYGCALMFLQHFILYAGSVLPLIIIYLGRADG